MVHPCTTWFEQVRDEDIVIEPNDIRSEAFGNLRHFSLSPDEWLNSPWLHGIRLETLEAVPACEVEKGPEQFTLAVWAQRLP